MKKLLTVLLILTATPAIANDQGAWVKVDSNGNAIGGAIVCTPDVCGDVNSPYAKATLQPGERYVLQTKADANGNVAGIGKQDNAEVKVNLDTNQWTITRKEVVEVPRVIHTPSETVDEPVTSSESTTVTSKVKITAEKTTIATINDDATTTVIEQHAELDTTILETPPVASEIELTDWFQEWLKEWQDYFNAIAILFEGWFLTW